MKPTLYHADCISVDEKDISLIYTDPPYSSKQEDQFYGTGDTFEQYLEFMEARLSHLKKCLKPEGSNILVHLDQKAVHYVKVMMDTIFGRKNFRNEIIWCYSSPSVATRWLPKKHDLILHFSVGEKYTFNQPFVPYTAKLTVGGKTAWNPDVKAEDYIDKGKRLEDWWVDVASLCRNEKERLGYKTQKPLKLMERIVNTFSNLGDKVYDPFCGSGSLLHAAAKLGRVPVGADISPEAIEITNRRLETL